MFTRLIQSFKHAIDGVRLAWHGLPFRVISVVGMIVFFLIAMLPVTRKETIVLILVISFVMVLEILNTIIEHLVDMFRPRLHDYVRIIKDMMAAAVLVASAGALIIGILIFGPYLFGQ